MEQISINPFRESRRSPESKDKHVQKDKEFVGTLLESIISGSAAEIADLRTGDILTRIDGERIVPGGKTLEKIMRNQGEPITFTVLRNGKTIEATLHPICNPSYKRYTCGFTFTNHNFVRSTDVDGREKLLERLQGIYQNADGTTICDYAIDVDLTKNSFEARGSSLTGRNIEGIVLSTPETSIDILKRFNPHNVPIILSEELQAIGGGGFHDPDENKIVISEIGTPAYIHVLLHELTHADQQNDKSWEPYLNSYDQSQFLLNPLNAWNVNYVQVLIVLRHRFPQILDEGDYVAAGEKTEKILEEGREDTINITRIKNELERAPFSPVLSNTNNLDYLRKKIGGMNKYKNRPSDPHWENDRQKLIEQFKEHGIETDFSGVRKLDDFYSLLDSIDFYTDGLRISNFSYDKENEEYSLQLLDKSSGRKISIKTTVSNEDMVRHEEQVAAQIDEIKKLATAVEECCAQALAVEIKPGLTVGDALSFPRWFVERDAERGALVNLRKIKLETGMNFFQPLSPLTKNQQDILALVNDKELMETQPKEITESFKRSAKAIQKFYETEQAKSVIGNVNNYMNLIGAKPRTIRKLKAAGIQTGPKHQSFV
jgi:hypothetical protein